MEHLPITHITLYKHGIGFFERRGQFTGEQVELSFRVEEMNDILKSLNVIDTGAGHVLSIDYATPQSIEERLAGCSVRLGDGRSLRDLLRSLRGRCVRLTLDQQETVEGVLLGLDELPERQPLAAALVSILREMTAQVQVVPLGRVLGVDVLDERGASDLRFFLETSLSQEHYRRVTIRLSPGDHELAVSYIAPAPTWRVSYRLAVDSSSERVQPRVLLLGWGIFDNRLEEDLQGISLSLTAGMPISFVYDLYTPFMPERPVVKEEARVAAAPVDFSGVVQEEDVDYLQEDDEHLAKPAFIRARTSAPLPVPLPPLEMRVTHGVSLEDMQHSTPATAKGADLGELFQYVIDTPVTVGRGQSAMAPIISAQLTGRKEWLYNDAKLPAHPVATLRINNATELTLERGPVTVIENGEYVGEAVLPFTVVDGEIVVPYAVELGVKVREDAGLQQEIHCLSVKGAYLLIEEWEIYWRTYQVNNTTSQSISIFVEHPRSTTLELFETPEPQERTDEHLRFLVAVAPRQETTLRVQGRMLRSRKEALLRQELEDIREYLDKGLLDREMHDRIIKLLHHWQAIRDKEHVLKQVDKDRQKIYQAQQQIQGNMSALGTQGKEGALRAKYVDQLEIHEEQLQLLARQEEALTAEIAKMKAELDAQMAE